MTTMSRGNATAYYRTRHAQAIRQARTYHAQAFSAGPNFTHLTRAQFRSMARDCLARAAGARYSLTEVLQDARKAA